LVLSKGTVDAALKLIDAGLSAGQAAKRLGIGRSTLYRIAQNLK